MFLDPLFYKDSSLKHNILLIGPVGVGKSSFVNSIFTTINESTIPIVRAVCGGNEIVTTEIKSYSFPNMKNKTFMNFRIWDTPGWHESTIVNNYLWLCLQAC